MFWESFLRQDLDQTDEPKTIGEVHLEVLDVLVDHLQPLVGPPGEGVLLDALPLGVLREVRLHLVVLLGVLPIDWPVVVIHADAGAGMSAGEKSKRGDRRSCTCSPLAKGGVA